MASGTADLQRDLGGAILQSIMGALLTAGYAAEFSKEISSSPNSSQVSANVQSELTKSFDSAAHIAEQPQNAQYSKQIVSAAKEAFIHGQHWAFASGVIAVVLGAFVVGILFPRRSGEIELLASYQRIDAGPGDHAGAGPKPAPVG
jgi:hypothetical protein